MRGAIHPRNFKPDSVHSVSTTEATLPLTLNTVLADVVDIREIVLRLLAAAEADDRESVLYI